MAKLFDYLGFGGLGWIFSYAPHPIIILLPDVGQEPAQLFKVVSSRAHVFQLTVLGP